MNLFSWLFYKKPPAGPPVEDPKTTDNRNRLTTIELNIALLRAQRARLEENIDAFQKSSRDLMGVIAHSRANLETKENLLKKE